MTNKTCRRGHVEPISRGGADSIDNIAVTHEKCNKKKHAKTHLEYRECLAS
jgi:5-methylcytosine-specific restriction endonuclease McrA